MSVVVALKPRDRNYLKACSAVWWSMLFFWLDSLLGLWTEYLHLIFPLLGFLSVWWLDSKAERERNEMEIVSSLSPRLEVTKCNFYLILFIRSKSLRQIHIQGKRN